MRKGLVLLAILLVLAGCDDTRTSNPKTNKPSIDSSDLPTVHAGDSCSMIGSMAKTKNGTIVKCIKNPGESHARWRLY